MIKFKILDTRCNEEVLGLIPHFFSEADPRTAAQQLDDAYQHGGGWRPMKGWKAGPVGELAYPGDSPMQPIAVATLHDNEIIRFYPHAWVSITQTDSSFEVSRVD